MHLLGRLLDGAGRERVAGLLTMKSLIFSVAAQCIGDSLHRFYRVDSALRIRYPLEDVTALDHVAVGRISRLLKLCGRS